MDPRLPVDVPLVNPAKMPIAGALGPHRSPRGITADEDASRVRSLQLISLCFEIFTSFILSIVFKSHEWRG